MKKITLEMFKDFEVNVKGFKVCEQGDYSKIEQFNVACVFPDSCVFGDRTEFHSSTEFGAYSKFGDRCKFDGYNEFGDNCEFGDSCTFEDCYFGNSSVFGRYSKFKSWCEIKDNSVIGDNSVFLNNCSVENCEVPVFVLTFGDVYFNNCKCEFGEIDDTISLSFGHGYEYTIIRLESGDMVYVYSGGNVVALNDVNKFIEELDKACSNIEDEGEREGAMVCHARFKDFVRMIKK